MSEIKSVLDKSAAAMSEVSGILAVVLGGSRARGNEHPGSDVDIGIYYDSTALDLAALNHAAQTVDDEHRENLITAPGGWGQWSNGGGWLVIDGRPADFILRDFKRVERIVAECLDGIVSPHYQTGHPHAFINVMYMGELAVSRLLWEKDERVSCLKRTAERYPEALQKALIHLFSFEMEFSFWLAESSADKDDIYYVTAHAVRSVSALNQVMFALNRQYCLNEKKTVKMIDGFSVRPSDYKNRVDAIFDAIGSNPKSACAMLRDLIYEAKSLLAPETTGHVSATMSILSDSKDNTPKG